MAALESLKLEHELIARALKALDTFAARLDVSGSLDSAALGRFTKFLQEFVELWHHEKEEDILLPTLVRHGFAWDEGPVARVREDHDQESYLGRVVQQAVAQEAAWSEEDRRHLVAAIRSFTEFERKHIQNEESLLFGAAVDRLPPEALAEIEEKMSELATHRFGHGGYERLIEDAKSLCKAYEA